MNYTRLEAQLELDEGKKSHMYKDTKGNWTAGVGRNLSARGFSDDEIALMLSNDINLSVNELYQHLPWFINMNDVRQEALANMCFNLGIERLLEFKITLQALVIGDYNAAASDVLNSKWAGEVGARADRIAEAFRRGVV